MRPSSCSFGGGSDSGWIPPLGVGSLVDRQSVGSDPEFPLLPAQQVTSGGPRRPMEDLLRCGGVRGKLAMMITAVR
ncbi:MAG: hypothetical protein OXH85_04720 [Truepera sp.]|nr:hypothetical protein [Truepera sp.]